MGVEIEPPNVRDMPKFVFSQGERLRQGFESKWLLGGNSGDNGMEVNKGKWRVCYQSSYHCRWLGLNLTEGTLEAAASITFTLWYPRGKRAQGFIPRVLIRWIIRWRLLPGVVNSLALWPTGNRSQAVFCGAGDKDIRHWDASNGGCKSGGAHWMIRRTAGREHWWCVLQGTQHQS